MSVELLSTTIEPVMSRDKYLLAEAVADKENWDVSK